MPTVSAACDCRGRICVVCGSKCVGFESSEENLVLFLLEVVLPDLRGGITQPLKCACIYAKSRDRSHINIAWVYQPTRVEVFARTSALFHIATHALLPPLVPSTKRQCALDRSFTPSQYLDFLIRVKINLITRNTAPPDRQQGFKW